MGSDTTKTSDPDLPNKRKAHRQVISDSETEAEKEKEVKKTKTSSVKLEAEAPTTVTPMDINELGISLFDLRRITSKIFRTPSMDSSMDSVADLVSALKSTTSAAPPVQPTARDTENRLSTLVETLKKELTSHGLSIPSEGSADEIAKLEKRLQACSNSLASLLGQIPPQGGLTLDPDDKHVNRITDLAKMMIAED
ncbi:hypothetical protein R1sor_017594 [Riccia sorocarpa]|uniref:Phosphoprotein n=1 Tax=Riccia sorocarpa TaxID=122646 RepID=A0ABD3I7C7_9MARC